MNIPSAVCDIMIATLLPADEAALFGVLQKAMQLHFGEYGAATASASLSGKEQTGGPCPHICAGWWHHTFTVDKLLTSVLPGCSKVPQPSHQPLHHQVQQRPVPSGKQPAQPGDALLVVSCMPA